MKVCEIIRNAKQERAVRIMIGMNLNHDFIGFCPFNNVSYCLILKEAVVSDVFSKTCREALLQINE